MGLGAAAHQGQIAARLGLGQVHGAGPFAGHEVFQIDRLLLVRRGGQQRLDGAFGQKRAQRKTHVGGVQHLGCRRTDGARQALSAELFRVGQALPAHVHEFGIGLGETIRQGHMSVLIARADLIAGGIEGGNFFGDEAGKLREGRFGVFKLDRLIGGQGADFGPACQVGDVEDHVLYGGIECHGLAFRCGCLCCQIDNGLVAVYILCRRKTCRK